MARRILVLSASVGAGHVRAAQAVELAIRQLDPQAVVENRDILEFATAAFRQVYGKSYLDLVNKAPYVLGYFYDLMDRPRSPGRRSDRLRLVVQKLNLAPFLRFLKAGTWDLIICTHFLPAEIIASLRRKRRLHAPQFVVTTDFGTHRLWVNAPCERYFTATEEGAAYLVHWGAPPDSVTAVGIPIHPAFSAPKDRTECLARHGLAGDRPMILLLAGGFGVGPVEELFRAVLATDVPLEVVVVTGRNAPLKKKLERIEASSAHRVHILGFTDQMDELMAVSDIVVSKPGGLTTSETLARGAVMAIVNPIPGQESRNSDFLLENGAAIKINSPVTLPQKLARLLQDPERLASLRANAKRLARPQAAFDVARAALTW